MIYYKLVSYTAPLKEMDINYNVDFGHTQDIDNETMYRNTHFTNKEEALECQKANLLAGIESCKQIINQNQKEIDKFEALKDRYYIYYDKITRT